MTGSLRVKNGIYQAILRFKNKQNKKDSKSISTGIKFKKDGDKNNKQAQAKLYEFIKEYAYLEYGYISKADGDSKILFVETIKEWLDNKKNRGADSTYDGLTIYVNKHILPYFEKMNLCLDDVTPKHIKDYYEYKYKNGRRDRKSGGLSIPSIKKHSQTLKQIFNDAYINEPNKKNPARDVKLPAKDETKVTGVFLSQDEANTMLEAFDGHELEALVYTTLYYGLRRSEVLGLKWSAIDFDNGRVYINHTVVKNLSIEYKNSTKTDSSKRTLELLDDVKDLLLKLKEKQAENKKIFGRDYKKSDYIFKYADGRLYRPDSITRSFQRVLKNHGLQKMRFHDLRHS